MSEIGVLNDSVPVDDLISPVDRRPSKTLSNAGRAQVASAGVRAEPSGDHFHRHKCIEAGECKVHTDARMVLS